MLQFSNFELKLFVISYELDISSVIAFYTFLRQLKNH